MLPSGYIPCAGLRSQNFGYVNINLVPSNTISADILFDGTSWIFGARNANSNTSAGQMNLYVTGAGENCYTGYRSGRVSLGEFGIGGTLHFHIGDAEAELRVGNTRMSTVSLNTGAFTGNQPMYLFALNNAGSALTEASVVIYGAIFKDGGVMVRNLIPAYDGTNYGLYDTVNDVFYTPSSANSLYSMYLVTVEHSDGGDASIETLQAGLVKRAYGGCNGPTGYAEYTPVHLVATPSPNYSFQKWVDAGGNLISVEKELDYVPTADVSIRAIFTKNIDKDFKTGFKALAIKYGSIYNERTKSYRDDFFAEVEKASINVDVVQKSTSSITLKEVPSVYQPNMPIFVFNPRGMIVYYGIIEKIEENVLTCREPLFLVDNEYLKHTIAAVKTSIGVDYSKYNIMYQFAEYVSRRRIPTDITTTPLTDQIYHRLNGQLYVTVNEKQNLAYEDNLSVYSEDVTEPTVINREEWAFDLFNKFGIVCVPKLAIDKWEEFNIEGHTLQLIISYYKQFRKMVIGDNNEEITNVSITEQDVETTYLYIFNSAGNTLRGIRAVNNDGTVVEYDGSEASAPNLIAYNTLKYKIVNSDDKIKNIVAENLGNAKYNHTIKFDMDLTGSFYHFEDIQVGAPCDFHYKGKKYESIVTGLTFDIDPNVDDVIKGKVTLGKARNNLTSKLNLGKVKKK